MPDMVLKQAQPTVTSAPIQPETEPKTVQFAENEEAHPLHVLSDSTPTGPTLETDAAAGKYIGEMFGKPLSSPVKPIQRRKKSCRKWVNPTFPDL